MSHDAGELLQLPTDELLKKFASGGHKPGSGSAAALLGLLACKLLQTVISLTDRPGYESSKQQLSLVNQGLLGEIEPALVDAFREDSIQFDRVIQARHARDAQKDPALRESLGRKALAELRKATDIPMSIAEKCTTLAERGLDVFDLGFRAARGDSSVAISSALAGASGALAIVYLNLKSFRGAKWATESIASADSLQKRVAGLQVQFVDRVARLRDDATKAQPATEGDPAPS